MSDSVSQNVRQVAADLFGVPIDRVVDQMSPQTLASWDSVQHLNLVLALEAQLGLRFEPAEIEQMQSIADVIRITTDRVGQRQT